MNRTPANNITLADGVIEDEDVDASTNQVRTFYASPQTRSFCQNSVKTTKRPCGGDDEVGKTKSENSKAFSFTSATEEARFWAMVDFCCEKAAERCWGGGVVEVVAALGCTCWDVEQKGSTSSLDGVPTTQADAGGEITSRCVLSTPQPALPFSAWLRERQETEVKKTLVENLYLLDLRAGGDEVCENSTLVPEVDEAHDASISALVSSADRIRFREIRSRAGQIREQLAVVDRKYEHLFGYFEALELHRREAGATDALARLPEGSDEEALQRQVECGLSSPFVLIPTRVEETGSDSFPAEEEKIVSYCEQEEFFASDEEGMEGENCVVSVDDAASTGSTAARDFWDAGEDENCSAKLMRDESDPVLPENGADREDFRDLQSLFKSTPIDSLPLFPLELSMLVKDRGYNY
ncbi:unnamed protein product [Amoebophrya sp. A120]|nr:unnamed protein product [Amoebophrya sp. A120]|eukprot:GSA120T00015689001.1